MRCGACAPLLCHGAGLVMCDTKSRGPGQPSPSRSSHGCLRAPGHVLAWLTPSVGYHTQTSRKVA